MVHALLVGGGESRADLPDDHGDARQVQGARLHQGPQGGPLHELHDQERLAVGHLPRVEGAHDTGVIDTHEGLDLLAELLLQPFAALGAVEQDLDHHLPRVELLVAGEVHDTDAAPAELLLDPVAVFEQ